MTKEKGKSLYDEVADLRDEVTGLREELDTLRARVILPTSDDAMPDGGDEPATEGFGEAGGGEPVKRVQKEQDNAFLIQSVQEFLRRQAEGAGHPSIPTWSDRPPEQEPPGFNEADPGISAGPEMENGFDPLEVWPALVITAADPITARIWIPGSTTFPPTVTDNYHLTEDDETVNVAFEQIGGGTFAARTLIPTLRDYDDQASPVVDDWIQVRCQPGAYTTETVTAFSGTLAAVPLPFSVTFEYEIAPDTWRRLVSTRTVDAASDFKVDFAGDGTGWYKVRTGLWQVTLITQPYNGARGRVRYLAASDCKWSWVEVAQTIPVAANRYEVLCANDADLLWKPGWVRAHG